MDVEHRCSICLDRLNQSSPLSYLPIRQEKERLKLRVRLDPCKHEFHRGCIERWLSGNQRMTCAYCRTKAKQVTCCSSNQVVSTLPVVSANMFDDISPRLFSPENGEIMARVSLNSNERIRRRQPRSERSSLTDSSRSSVSNGANSSNGHTASSSGGTWFMQKIRRLRQRMESSSSSNIQPTAISNIVPSIDIPVINSPPNLSLEPELLQLVETLDDLVPEAFSPST